MGSAESAVPSAGRSPKEGPGSALVWPECEALPSALSPPGAHWRPLLAWRAAAGPRLLPRPAAAPSAPQGKRARGAVSITAPQPHSYPAGNGCVQRPCLRSAPAGCQGPVGGPVEGRDAGWAWGPGVVTGTTRDQCRRSLPHSRACGVKQAVTPSASGSWPNLATGWSQPEATWMQRLGGMGYQGSSAGHVQKRGSRWPGVASAPGC